MRIEVVGRNFEITDPIRAHAESKVSKLSHFDDLIQQMTLTVRPEHAHQSREFTAELVIDVEKHADFVSRATGADVYLLIDQVVEKGARQLKDFKERLKGQ